MKKDPVKKNMDKLHKPKTHKSKKDYDRKSESEKMQDELEPIDDSRADETFKRYAGYREWNKTHDSYKVIHSPTNTDEHGKKIKDD